MISRLSVTIETESGRESIVSSDSARIIICADSNPAIFSGLKGDCIGIRGHSPIKDSIHRILKRPLRNGFDAGADELDNNKIYMPLVLRNP